MAKKRSTEVPGAAPKRARKKSDNPFDHPPDKDQKTIHSAFLALKNDQNQSLADAVSAASVPAAVGAAHQPEAVEAVESPMPPMPAAVETAEAVSAAPLPAAVEALGSDSSEPISVAVGAVCMPEAVEPMSSASVPQAEEPKPPAVDDGEPSISKQDVVSLSNVLQMVSVIENDAGAAESLKSVTGENFKELLAEAKLHPCFYEWIMDSGLSCTVLEDDDVDRSKFLAFLRWIFNKTTLMASTNTSAPTMPLPKKKSEARCD
jgi:hypothetical protein